MKVTFNYTKEDLDGVIGLLRISGQISRDDSNAMSKLWDEIAESDIQDTDMADVTDGKELEQVRMGVLMAAVATQMSRKEGGHGM